MQLVFEIRSSRWSQTLLSTWLEAFCQPRTLICGVVLLIRVSLLICFAELIPTVNLLMAKEWYLSPWKAPLVKSSYQCQPLSLIDCRHRSGICVSSYATQMPPPHCNNLCTDTDIGITRLTALIGLDRIICLSTCPKITSPLDLISDQSFINIRTVPNPYLPTHVQRFENACFVTALRNLSSTTNKQRLSPVLRILG